MIVEQTQQYGVKSVVLLHLEQASEPQVVQLHTCSDNNNSTPSDAGQTSLSITSAFLCQKNACIRPCTHGTSSPVQAGSHVGSFSLLLYALTLLQQLCCLGIFIHDFLQQQQPLVCLQIPKGLGPNGYGVLACTLGDHQQPCCRRTVQIMCQQQCTLDAEADTRHSGWVIF